MTLKGYADLADLPEDDRIRIIGETAEQGHVVGLFIESAAAADRYIQKLTTRHRVRLVSRSPGPVAGVILVKVGPAES